MARNNGLLLLLAAWCLRGIHSEAVAAVEPLANLRRESRLRVSRRELRPENEGAEGCCRASHVALHATAAGRLEVEATCVIDDAFADEPDRRRGRSHSVGRCVLEDDEARRYR